MYIYIFMTIYVHIYIYIYLNVYIYSRKHGERSQTVNIDVTLLRSNITTRPVLRLHGAASLCKYFKHALSQPNATCKNTKVDYQAMRKSVLIWGGG